SNSTEPATTALPATSQPAPTTLPPVTDADPATVLPSSIKDSPTGPGNAADGAIPLTRSADPATKSAGLPRSRQYVASTWPTTRAPASSRSGNVSRSTETGRPVGIRSITERE